MASFPERFGPFVLERFIARGGMAEVFLARRSDGAIEGPLCVKRMLPDMMKTPEYVVMFRDEARLSQRLVHQNVVRVLDSGEADGRMYMAMEYVDGMDVGTLQRKLRQRGEMLGVGHALRIAVDTLSGLAYAHALVDDAGRPLQLIHRDISPQNILVSARGEVKVTDFGIAKAVGRETRTQTGLIKGKVQYMSPEQALGGAIDQRLDQFAAAIVVWEMLTGQRLYAEKSELLTFEKIIRHPPPKPSSVRQGIPAFLDGIVQRGLAKNPDARFPDCASFAGALAEALERIDAPSNLGAVMEHVMSGREGSLQQAVAAASPPPQVTSAPRSRGLVVSKPGAVPLDEAPTRLTPRTAAPASAPPPGPPVAGRLPTSAMSPLPTPPTAPDATLALDQTVDRLARVDDGARAMPVAPAPVSDTAAPPRPLPVPALAAALVVGLGVGFAIARATAPAPKHGADCPLSSSAKADQGAAQAALAAATDAFSGGDLAMAERRASEAEKKSGSAAGELLLGKIALAHGDRLAALSHFRCVVALDPSSDAATELERKLR